MGSVHEMICTTADAVYVWWRFKAQEVTEFVSFSVFFILAVTFSSL